MWGDRAGRGPLRWPAQRETLNHSARTNITYDGKRVVALALSDSLPPARIAAVHLAVHRPRAAAQAFLDHARDYFASESAR